MWTEDCVLSLRWDCLLFWRGAIFAVDKISSRNSKQSWHTATNQRAEQKQSRSELFFPPPWLGCDFAWMKLQTSRHGCAFELCLNYRCYEFTPWCLLRSRISEVSIQLKNQLHTCAGSTSIRWHLVWCRSTRCLLHRRTFLWLWLFQALDPASFDTTGVDTIA